MTSFFNRAKALSILAFSASMAFAATPTVEIGTWGNFASGALSHTFDDNMNTDPSKDEQKIFDQYGFHMTCFVQTGSVNWTNAKATFAKGHEIANHTVSHTSDVSGMNTAQTAIKQNVPGEKCATIAYPNCNTPGDAEVLKTHIAGRNCDGQTAATSPKNFAQISSKMFGAGAGGYSNDAASLNTFADQAATSKGWSVYCFHGIGTQSHNWAVISMDAIKGHLTYLDTKRDKIWVETFGNVARYIKERDAAKATVTSSDDKTIQLTLTDNLPDSIYNFPLSLRFEMPSGWTGATVTQKGKVMFDTTVTVSSKSYLMFQAVPDGGDIVITSGAIPVVNGKISGSATGLKINCKNSTLDIALNNFNKSGCTVSLFDLSGKLLTKERLSSSQAQLSMPIAAYSNSAFIVQIDNGVNIHTEKITPQM